MIMGPNSSAVLYSPVLGLHLAIFPAFIFSNSNSIISELVMFIWEGAKEGIQLRNFLPHYQGVCLKSRLLGI